MAVSDSFTGTGALSGNWSTAFGTPPTCVSNEAKGASAGAYAASYWSANSFSGTQTSEATVVNANYCAVGVNVSAVGGGSGWWFFAHNGSIQHTVAGTTTSITLSSGAPVAGEKMRVSFNPATDTYKAFIFTGGSWVEVYSIVDTSFAYGAPGIGFYDNTGILDDWVGTGEVAGGGGGLAGTIALMGCGAS